LENHLTRLRPSNTSAMQQVLTIHSLLPYTTLFRSIKASLASEPQMFMAYNNGISTVADGIDIDESNSSGDVVTITEITGWQIVNGGQTTASIYNAYKSKLPLDQVNVQIKLSVIKKKDQAEDIIHNISKYANSQ